VALSAFHVLNATAQSGNWPGFQIKKRPFPARLHKTGLFSRSADRDPPEGISAKKILSCYRDIQGKTLEYYEHILTREL
jgi:hypothetical protein